MPSFLWHRIRRGRLGKPWLSVTLDRWMGNALVSWLLGLILLQRILISVDLSVRLLRQDLRTVVGVVIYGTVIGVLPDSMIMACGPVR